MSLHSWCSENNSGPSSLESTFQAAGAFARGDFLAHLRPLVPKECLNTSACVSNILLKAALSKVLLHVARVEPHTGFLNTPELWPESHVLKLPDLKTSEHLGGVVGRELVRVSSVMLLYYCGSKSLRCRQHIVEERWPWRQRRCTRWSRVYGRVSRQRGGGVQKVDNSQLQNREPSILNNKQNKNQHFSQREKLTKNRQRKETLTRTWANMRQQTWI